MTVNLLKKLSIATVSTAAIGFSLFGANPAQALVGTSGGFQDEYAPEAWTFENQNADGSVDVSNAPDSITLTGGDHGEGGSGTSWYTAIALADGLVNFDWIYTTLDWNAGWDPFGYILNGVFTQLTDDSLGDQSGSMSFSVMEGDTFGFGINTKDNAVGAATVTVSKSVPEPATLAALAVVGVGGLLSKKKLSSASEK